MDMQLRVVTHSRIGGSIEMEEIEKSTERILDRTNNSPRGGNWPSVFEHQATSLASVFILYLDSEQ